MQRTVEAPVKDQRRAVAPARVEPAAGVASERDTALQLQQQAGNQAVQSLFRSGAIRAKLAISNPDDPEEREADHVAQSIMRSAAGFPVGSHCSCADGEEMCEQCKQKQGGIPIQRSASAPAAPVQATRLVHEVLRSSGRSLDHATRAFFEPRFGHDFSHVRVHTGMEAAESARSINANAYTFGSDIVFGPDQYQADSSDARHLLAHELTHVVQQGECGRRLASEFTGSVKILSQSARRIQRFGSTEHEKLGDTTGIATIDLGGGVVLSWGQVVALAGDYYGTVEDLLADTTTVDGRARIRAAMEAGGLPSVATTTLPVPGPKDKEAVTAQYLKLAIQNIPHFLGGGTSRETWLEYHSRAIDSAVREGLAGTPLNQGYLLEAFGEHFYTDSFSGGHIRTPRKDISDWYSTVFGPRVVDHFVDTLRSRLEGEIYWQVGGPAADLLIPGSGLAIQLFIHHKVGEKLDAAIAGIGGRAVMVEWFGLIVGGMVSGAIHDLEGDRGVVVNSKAHATPWTAYGDGKLDDPRNAVSKSEAITGIAEAKADVDQAYLIGSGERVAKTSVPIPAPSALPTTVYFKFDSAALSGGATADMRGALAYMIYNPDAEVSIVGYTDPIGTPSYNMGLGNRRADAVASVLLKGGVDPKRVPTASAGATGLVTTKPTDYWLDRRVTLAWSWPVTGSTAISHDVAYERALAAVKSRIGPPYLAENRLPEPVAGANPAVPEWHWGKLDPSFQAEIASWVGKQVKPKVGAIISSPKLDPIPITLPKVGTVVNVEPRPIVQGIIDDLLADPIDFLNKGFGEKAGP